MNSQEQMMEDTRKLRQVQTGEVFHLMLEELRTIRGLLEWDKADTLEMRAHAAEQAEQEQAAIKALQDRMVEEQLAAGRKLQEEQAATQKTLMAESARRYREEAEQMYRKHEAGYHKDKLRGPSSGHKVPA